LGIEKHQASEKLVDTKKDAPAFALPCLGDLPLLSMLSQQPFPRLTKTHNQRKFSAVALLFSFSNNFTESAAQHANLLFDRQSDQPVQTVYVAAQYKILSPNDTFSAHPNAAQAW
jgi:hypothetical protein